MKEQGDSEERRDLSKQLACVLMGIEDFENVQAAFRGSPFSIRHIEIPSGQHRFVITDRRTGKVHDSFTFDEPQLMGAMKEPDMDKHYDRDRIFDEEHRSDFLWCLHCERAYNRGQFRKVNGLQMCPYEGCDGDTVLDGWDWETVRESHPEYPTIPIEGKIYPLYDERPQTEAAACTVQRAPFDIPPELSALFGCTIDSTISYKDPKERKERRQKFCDGDEVRLDLRQRIEDAGREAMEELIRKVLPVGAQFRVRAEVLLLTNEDDDEIEEAFSTDVDVFTGDDEYNEVVSVIQENASETAIIAALRSAFGRYMEEIGISSESLSVRHELSGYSGN